jgi:hypothetical protein
MVGPGLLNRLTKYVVEIALEAEMDRVYPVVLNCR